MNKTPLFFLDILIRQLRWTRQ